MKDKAAHREAMKLLHKECIERHQVFTVLVVLSVPVLIGLAFWSAFSLSGARIVIVGLAYTMTTFAVALLLSRYQRDCPQWKNVQDLIDPGLLLKELRRVIVFYLVACGVSWPLFMWMARNEVTDGNAAVLFNIAQAVLLLISALMLRSLVMNVIVYNRLKRETAGAGQDG